MLEFIIIIAIIGILIVLGLRLPDVLRESRGLPPRSNGRPLAWFEDAAANKTKEPLADPLNLAPTIPNDAPVPAHEPNPSLEMADALFAQKNYDRAEGIYLQLARQEPKNPKLYNRLGVLFLERENYNDARDAFKAALAIDDSRASRHYNFAMACYHLGQLREAQDAMIQALKRDPRNGKYQAFAEQIRKTRS